MKKHKERRRRTHPKRQTWKTEKTDLPAFRTARVMALHDSWMACMSSASSWSPVLLMTKDDMVGVLESVTLSGSDMLLCFALLCSLPLCLHVTVAGSDTKKYSFVGGRATEPSAGETRNSLSIWVLCDERRVKKKRLSLKSDVRSP